MADAATITAPTRRPAGASEEWVASLPERIRALGQEWRLSFDDEQMAGGAWGMLLCCHTSSGGEAVLKLCADEGRLRAETCAMLAWADAPAVSVLAHRPGALLLARARPGQPSRLAPSRLARLTGTDAAFALRFGQFSAMYAALASR